MKDGKSLQHRAYTHRSVRHEGLKERESRRTKNDGPIKILKFCTLARSWRSCHRTKAFLVFG